MWNYIYIVRIIGPHHLWVSCCCVYVRVCVAVLCTCSDVLVFRVCVCVCLTSPPSLPPSLPPSSLLFLPPFLSPSLLSFVSPPYACVFNPSSSFPPSSLPPPSLPPSLLPSLPLPVVNSFLPHLPRPSQHGGGAWRGTSHTKTGCGRDCDSGEELHRLPLSHARGWLRENTLSQLPVRIAACRTLAILSSIVVLVVCVHMYTCSSVHAYNVRVGSL